MEKHKPDWMDDMGRKWKIAICAALTACLGPACPAETLTASEVLQLEQSLYALGYHDENCDAQLDETTRQALRSFQLANGLEVTGEPDAATLRLIEQGGWITCHEYLVDLAGEYVDLPILQQGSSGESVAAMQRALKSLGYFSGECDGVFGEASMAAVRRFQLANGLAQTGVADRSTQMRMNEGEPLTWDAFLETACAVPGDSGAQVRLLQRTLLTMGYFSGECSGVYGELTQQAVTVFQANNGLEPTGEADVLTCSALYSGGATVLRNPAALDVSDSQAVADLQSALAGLDYFDRNITGVYGPTTETAVRLFQMANGLPSTGEADEETLALLDSGAAVPLDGVRDRFLEQALSLDEAARTVLGSVAERSCGHSFEGDDEDLYEGFAFVQYVCVSAGIPVVAPSDLADRIDAPVADPSELQPGELLIFKLSGGKRLMAVCTGEGRAVYATPESGRVLEYYLRDMDYEAVYRWNPEAGE